MGRVFTTPIKGTQGEIRLMQADDELLVGSVRRDGDRWVAEFCGEEFVCRGWQSAVNRVVKAAIDR